MQGSILRPSSSGPTSRVCLALCPDASVLRLQRLLPAALRVSRRFEYNDGGCLPEGGKPMTKVLDLADIGALSVGDLIREVVVAGDVIRIRVSDRDTIELRNVGRLQPLITFEGHVPDGWKEAIYARE